MGQKQVKNKKAIFIASSPNTESDDVITAVKQLFSPWQWYAKGEHSAFTILRNTFAEIHNTQKAFLYNTGRTALYELLKAMGIGEGDEVIIQAFTCAAVPTGIIWSKATPVYVDIEEKTYNATAASYDLAITPQTRAVIVQHTFGIISPVEKVREIIEKHNATRTPERKIYIIEDCAHSLGTLYNGKRVGEWGDAAFFSFGQEKVVSCTQGGAVISHEETVTQSLSESYLKIRSQGPWNTFRMILHPILWTIINYTYYVPSFTGSFTLGRGLILLFRLIGLLQSQVAISKRSLRRKPPVKKLSNAQCHMLLNQLQKLSDFQIHRMHIAKRYYEYLSKSFAVPHPEYPMLRYPLRHANPIHLFEKLTKQRIIAGRWYTSVIYPQNMAPETLGYLPGTCRIAEAVSKTVINLPTSIGISTQEASVISTLLTSNYQTR